MKNVHIKIQHILYISGMGFLIIWLFFSNLIISKIINGDKIREVDFFSLREAYLKDVVYYSIQGIDGFSYDGGMTDRLTVDGWGLCETQKDDSERQVSFVLQNSDKCYELIPQIYPRHDVPVNLPDNINRPDMNIYSSNVGFMEQFSLLGIKDGIYNLYFCCYENEDNHGIADTLLQVEKHDNDVQIYTWLAHSLDKQMEITQETETIGNLGKIISEEEYIVIRGWEYVPDKNCNTQTVYVELTDSSGTKTLYDTKGITRTDVAVAYNNAFYSQSGYQANIPLDDFADDTYTIRILIENDGDVWQSREYGMIVENSVASKIY